MVQEFLLHAPSYFSCFGGAARPRPGRRTPCISGRALAGRAPGRRLLHEPHGPESPTSWHDVMRGFGLACSSLVAFVSLVVRWPSLQGAIVHSPHSRALLPPSGSINAAAATNDALRVMDLPVVRHVGGCRQLSASPPVGPV